MNKYLSSKIKLSINGINIYNFIQRLATNNIKIYNMHICSISKAEIIVLKSDLNTINKIKSTYEINIIREYGYSNIRRIIKKINYLIIIVMTCLFLLCVSSMFIYKVDVVHTNKELVENLTNQLSKYGIKKFSIKKGYNELLEIKQQILNNNKDILEWLEISVKGNKYIIKLEERIIPNLPDEQSYTNIISTKDAIITNISAKSGIVLKRINDYVKKGELLVTGQIFLNENLKDIKSAKAIIYGETWYKVTMEYPLMYSEKLYLKEEKNTLKLNLFFQLDLYDNNIFKLEHPLIPIELSYGKHTKILTNEYIYTQEEAMEKVKELAKQKIEVTLDKSLNEKIIDEKVLKYYLNNGNIYIEIFYKVNEIISKEESISVEEKDVSKECNR